MTARPTYPRSTCCITGCPRWSRKFEPGEEWICGRHWRVAPARCRRALRRAWRALADAYSRFNGSEHTMAVWRLCNRLYRLQERLWEHLKRRVVLWEAGL